MRVTGSVERPADRLRARVLAGVDAAAEPGICGDLVGARERTRREARLVAGHAGSRRRTGWRSAASRRASASAYSTPWLRTAAARIRRLDAVVAPRVVDPGRDPAEVLRVGQPDRVGVAGRGDQLDVDAPSARARGEVLVGDVAVVLGGADHARRHVVGGEEVQEVRPAERVLVREQTVGERDARCARRAGGRARAAPCPRGARAARPWGSRHAILPATAGAGSRRVVARRGRRRAAPRSAASAPASSRACTTASGRSGPTSRADGRDLASARRPGRSRRPRGARLPPRPVIDEADGAAVHPAHRRPRARARPRAARARRRGGRRGARARSAGPPSAATMRAKRSAAAPESSARSARRRARRPRRARSPPWTSSEAASASVTSCRRGSRARAGEVVDRLAHLERVAGGRAEHLVHVGQQRDGRQPGAAGDLDERAGELLGRPRARP